MGNQPSSTNFKLAKFKSDRKCGIEFDYKEMVIDILNDVQVGKTHIAMLELRITLFVTASYSQWYQYCLHPFPPCFFNPEKNIRDYNAMWHHIQTIPALKDLTVDNERLSLLTWQLIYWIFTNPLTINPLFNTHLVHPPGLEDKLQEKTGLILPPPGYFIFEIRIPSPKPVFMEGRAKYGTYFAFHGSPLRNFHSIIHRGLLCALNRRSLLGSGTYFTSEFEVSKRYCKDDPNSSQWYGEGWYASMFGKNQYCVVICEIVNSPCDGLKKYQFKNHPNLGNSLVSVVTNDDLIQHAYLLLFGSGFEFACTPAGIGLVKRTK